VARVTDQENQQDRKRPRGVASGMACLMQVAAPCAVSTTPALGQIAMASFQNDQGLVRNGSNEFLESLASGPADIGAPGTGGRDTLSGGALEQSNVDIATRLAQLIFRERGY
jgi:flagellar hook protein FlgE